MSGAFRWSIDERIPTLDAPTTPQAGELGTGRVVGGQYRLEGVLGSGGMGRVYRGRDLLSGRAVAVKFLHGSPSPAQLERFRREGELTALLDHPGIVRIHGGGVEAGQPFLVYELVESLRELGDVMDAAPPERTVPLLLQVARALEHAHQRGVVHRDLKPQNVLVDDRGQVRVADFGVASAGWLGQLTETGGMVGTPPYMAPEQWHAKLGGVGPPADVWALGVLLYQCLTGAHPFPARTLLEQQAVALRARPTPPRALAPEVSPALEAVCLRALARSPGDRFPQAGAFAAALEAAWQGAPARRPRGRTLGLGLLVGLLAAAPLLLAARQAGAPGPGPSDHAAPASARGAPAPAAGAGFDHPLLIGLARGEPLAALAGERDDGEPAGLTAALKALERVPVDEAALAGCPPAARRAAAAWLLVQAERDLSLLEPGTFVAAEGALPPSERAARVTSRVSVAARVASELAPELDRARARLLPPGAPERAACLAQLLAARPDDPWGCCLEAEDQLARGQPGPALATLDRSALGQGAAWRRRSTLACARALRGLGRAGEALEALDRAPDPLDPELEQARLQALLDLGRGEEAALLRARLELLRGARREEAHGLVRRVQRAQQRVSTTDYFQDTGDLDRALALDPFSPFAAYGVGKRDYGTVQQRTEGQSPQEQELAAERRRTEVMLGLTRQVARTPWLLHDYQESCRVVLHERRTFDAGSLEALLASWDDTPVGRLGRSVIRCALVEYQGRDDLSPAALADLDALLAEEPRVVAAWTLRGFLHLRAGRLELARRDLDVAGEGYPDCPVRLLYEALLLAARRAPREEVLVALLRACEAGNLFWARRKTTSGWSLQLYPELARYDPLRLALEVRDRRVWRGSQPFPERWW